MKGVLTYKVNICRVHAAMNQEAKELFHNNLYNQDIIVSSETCFTICIFLAELAIQTYGDLFRRLQHRLVAHIKSPHELQGRYFKGEVER